MPFFYCRHILATKNTDCRFCNSLVVLLCLSVRKSQTLWKSYLLCSLTFLFLFPPIDKTCLCFQVRHILARSDFEHFQVSTCLKIRQEVLLIPLWSLSIGVGSIIADNSQIYAILFYMQGCQVSFC